VGPPGGIAMMGVAVTPDQPPRLYAATYAAGLWRSMEGGLMWKCTSCPAP
jgi:hypothetical protein